MEPELTIITLSLWLIVLLGLASAVYSLVFMWKESRLDWAVRGIIWFTVAIVSSCAIIVFLAGYIQKGRMSEKLSHHVEAVTFELK